MTETYIVLGMHRARTSLVSSLLNEMGIWMGNVLTSHPRINLYEDQEFLKLNQRILKVAGGDWRNPPTMEAVLKAGRGFGKQIGVLVRDRNKHRKWGWKDPRNCLTWPLYTSNLAKPKFVIIERNAGDVCRSLLRRNKGYEEGWLELIARYQKGINLAVKTKYPRLFVNSDLLVDRTTVDPVLEKLADFLQVELDKETVLPLIKFRK